MSNKSALQACALVLMQSLIYGYGDPITKYAYDRAPVYWVLALRYTISSLVILFFAWPRLRNSLTAEKIKVLIPPSLCIALAYFINNIALSLAPATTVAFLRSLSTIMVPILAFMLYRIKYDWRHLPIHILVVYGLYLLCGVADYGFSGFGLGEIITLIGASLLAATLVFGKNALKTVDGLTLTSVQTMASLFVCVPSALFGTESFKAEAFTLPVWGVILYLALLCTLGGYLLQNKALETISSSSVVLLQCTCPVMTAVFSYFVLGEQLTTNGMLGAAIILVCVVADTLLQQRER